MATELVNFGFIIDNRRCIGCHACTVACKSEHSVPVGVNRTWVKYIEKGEFPDSQRLFSVMRCNHCDNAPCIEICPVTALYRREDGIVDFDNRRCIGCKACMQACPYDALYIDPQTNTAAKCNYCAHRIDVGLEPACVNVCPTQAIISGDLNDPESKISRLKSEQAVSARKTEIGTLPALFYVDADAASLDPLAARAEDDFMWGSQRSGVGHFAHDSSDEEEHVLEKFGRLLSLGESSEKLTDGHGIANELLNAVAGEPRRAYDAPQKGVLWGWQVSGYLWTKSIAAGVVICVMLAKLISLEVVSQGLEMFSLITGLSFLGITGGLLIWDLDKPQRFLYVLLRPQWRSWLVKGAYVITVYSLLLLLDAALCWFSFNGTSHLWMRLPLLVLGMLTAIYTAFLFAQAKGRAFWQSKTVPLNMATHAVICGAAFLALFSTNWVPEFNSFLCSLLMIAAVIHIALTAVELGLPHHAEESRVVVKSIVSGRYSGLFWLAGMLAGTVLPAVLLISSSGTLVAAAILFLIGVFVSQHIWVRAPQQIPLS